MRGHGRGQDKKLADSQNCTTLQICMIALFCIYHLIIISSMEREIRVYIVVSATLIVSENLDMISLQVYE